jgi:hypothetical protein
VQTRTRREVRDHNPCQPCIHGARRGAEQLSEVLFPNEPWCRSSVVHAVPRSVDFD